VPTKKKLRGAIIGYGFISSKGHWPAYLERQDVEIIAICDICCARFEHLPKHIKTYVNYRDLLDQEAQNLDFVDIATNAATHFGIAKAALEQGLHVLCEKPLTTSLEQARILLETAKQHKRVLFPGHNYKHAPVVKAIREIIQSGKIGRVHSVNLNTYRNTHAVGTKEWMPDWRRFKQHSGGGIAMDHGSHSLYLTFEWLGCHPKAVTAVAHNLSFPKYDTEDNFSAVYEFESGLANVQLTWTAGIRKVIYAINGDKGAIVVNDDEIELSTMQKEESDDSSHKAKFLIEKYSIRSDWMDSSHINWFNSMFDKFLAAMECNDVLNDEIKDAYFCIQAIMKAYESSNNNSIKVNLNGDFPF